MPDDGAGPEDGVPSNTGEAGRETGRRGSRADGRGRLGTAAVAGSSSGRRRRVDETPDLRRLRGRIDALDRRLVALLNERMELGRAVGRAKAAAGRRRTRDVEREREVLLRASMANGGPLPQADLLSIYRRIIAATRGLEARDREGDGERG